MLKYFFVLLTLLSLTQSADAQTNDASFIETLRIGCGTIQHLEWHPDGERFLVDTINGAWLYRLVDKMQIVDDFHISQARNARFSTNGRIIAGIDEANNITLWDGYSYEHLKTITNSPYIHTLEWQPNGHLFASVDTSGRVVVWDSTTHQHVWELDQGVDNLSWSISGTYLATRNFDNTIIYIWRANGDLALTISPENSPFHGATSLYWRDDTRFLQAIGGEVPQGVEWDILTGEHNEISRISYYVSYSPDGSLRIAGGSRMTNIYDADTNEILLSIDRSFPSTVGWSLDGKNLALAHAITPPSQEARISIINIETGEILTSPANPFEFSGIYWHPEEKIYLAVDRANRIYIDYGMRSTHHSTIGNTIEWHNDGQNIVATNSSSGARMWDAQTGDIVIGQMFTSSSRPNIHKWQPNGDLSVAIPFFDRYNEQNRLVYVWDNSLHENSDDKLINIIPHANPVSAVEWSPDGQTLATLEQTRFIRFWQPAQPEIIRTLDLYQNRIYPFIDFTARYGRLSWSPDGRRVAFGTNSSGNYGNVYLIDVETFTISSAPTTDNSNSTFTWTPDNQFISATVNHHNREESEGIIRLGGEIFPDYDEQPLLTGLPINARDAIFSPDATKIIGFDHHDNAIIWDVMTQTPLHQFDHMKDAVWAPDNRQIALYGVDGFIHIVDVQSGTIIHQFNRHWRNNRSEDVSSVWSPDSTRLAIVDRGVLFIYDRTDQ